MRKRPWFPPERKETLRQQIRRHLENGTFTARQLGALVRIEEREVVTHLEHIQISLRREPVHLVVEPAACASCGFVFERRTRLSPPGTCPQCHSQRIEPPAFRIGRPPNS